MSDKIIVDTSIWIEYFKNNSDYVPFIEENLNLENIYMIGPIISELLHGVKDEKEHQLLLKSINAVPFLNYIFEDWIKTGSILFNLRKKGKIIPLTDVLISAISIRINASILTLDQHFKEIQGIKLLHFEY
jgi:tRNA(fMet)-specific endonuclease VapC